MIGEEWRATVEACPTRHNRVAVEAEPVGYKLELFNPAGPRLLDVCRGRCLDCGATFDVLEAITEDDATYAPEEPDGYTFTRSREGKP